MPASKSFLPTLYVSAFSLAACFLIVLCRWVYLHYGEPDFTLDLANFAVVLLPFAFSILFAFVPDMRTRHWGWQFGVIVVGIGFSLLLWKQQHLAIDAAKRDESVAINTAVTQSNEHSDKHIDTVERDLQIQKQHMDQRLDTLETHLGSGIEKLKSPPPKISQLGFSFYIRDQERFPLLIESVRSNSEGNFELELMVENTSEGTVIQNADLWMAVCDDCRFTSEPGGFEHIEGSPDQIRHKMLNYLNPRVSVEWKAMVTVPARYGSFDMAFKYACGTCSSASLDPQVLHVFVIPPFTSTTPNTKPKSTVRPFQVKPHLVSSQ